MFFRHYNIREIKPLQVPLTLSCAECVTVAASFWTRHVYVPLWSLDTLVMLRALVKSSFWRIVTWSLLSPLLRPLSFEAKFSFGFVKVIADAIGDMCDDENCDIDPVPKPNAATPPVPLSPPLTLSAEAAGGRGFPSFSHVNESGRSPVPITHWILVRSPTFKSRANENGVILGGTERWC